MWSNVEAERDALFLLNDLAGKAQVALQCLATSARKDDQSGGDVLACVELHAGRIRAGIDGLDASDAKLHVRGQAVAECVDKGGITQAELFIGRALEDSAIEGSMDF